MSADTTGEVVALLAPMLKRTFSVVISTAKVPSAQMEPHAAEHLRYMNALEASGALWASGPFVVPGVVVGDGLTIFNVPTEEDMHRLTGQEPLTRLGLRSYQAHKWELHEGAISIRLSSSASTFALT